jgi:glyoxylase-like metal-dependent hydrolase (beta-lactamase superfamily II)
MVDEATKSRVVELRPNIYLLKGEKPGGHVYLIRGTHKNLLIDTGLMGNFLHLKASLQYLGLRPRDVHLIILTHEHFDHIGATGHFVATAVVAAHRLAANKIELQDEFVTMMKYCDAADRPFFADLWLEEGSMIDLGEYRLHTLHTPGHTSGCICLHEVTEQLLFTGDTVFSGGTLSAIATSGNISDYMNSLRRLSTLKVKELYPGHGRASETPEADIQRGLEHAMSVLQDTKVLFDTLARKWGKEEMVQRALRRLTSPGRT